MHDLAYQDLHALEANHWWYQGMRTIYGRLLQHFARPGDRPVLDVGCGSGGNLSLLSAYGPVIGVDLAPAALEMWPERPTGLVQARADALPFVHHSFGLVTMLGLVEHVEDDLAVLREAARVCLPGGTVMLNTSAYMFLWSEHDEANRHMRRYLARELANKAQTAGLTVCKLTYANTFLFPIALIMRLLQRLVHRHPSGDVPRVDMFPMREPINTWLVHLLGLEARLMEWIDLPFGVSILSVLTPDRHGGRW